jgi:hypothetical protein
VNGYHPTYDNLPDDDETALHVARLCDGCAAQGVRREIAHDEQTLAFTDAAACLPCALFAFGCDLLLSRQPAVRWERLS